MGARACPARPAGWPIDVCRGANVDPTVVDALGASTPDSDVPPGSETIGRLSCTGAPAATWASMLESAQKKARSLGGDGILLNMTYPRTMGGGYQLDLPVVRYAPGGSIVPRAAASPNAPAV